MDLSEKAQDILRFAKFLGGKGVSVVFDGRRAETDGATIYLPMLDRMTDEQLEFMYAVLIHESGHVLYSDFSVEAFSMLNGRAHARMANFLEDGRIELLTIRDFPGARDILGRLYSDLVLDESVMRPFGGVSHDEADDCYLVGSYAQSQMTGLAFSPNLSEAQRSRAEQLVSKHGLGRVISGPIMDWKSVVEASAKIIEALGVRDDPIDVGAAQRAVGDAASELSEIPATHAEQLKFLEAEYRDARRALIDFRNASGYKDIEAGVKSRQAKITSASKVVSEIVDQLKSQVKSARARRRAERLKDLADQAGVTASKSKAETRRDHFLEKQKRLMAAMANALADARLHAAEGGVATQSDLDAANEKHEGFLKEYKDYVDPHRDTMAEHGRLVLDKKAKQAAYDAARGKVMSKVIDVLKALREFGIDVPLSGAEFAPCDGWSAADEAQHGFDDEAMSQVGVPVQSGRKATGSGSGFSSRDVLAMIAGAADGLSKMDIAKQFSDLIPSYLTDRTSMIRNTLAESDDPVFEGALLVNTTDFDVVTRPEIGDMAEFGSAVARNKLLIESLSKAFARKLTSRTMRKLRSGRDEGEFDGNAAWKLASGEGDDFFRTVVRTPRNENAVSVLIDMSGSMDRGDNEDGAQSAELAIVISEALRKASVSHEVIGFHAPVCQKLKEKGFSGGRDSNSLEHVVFKSLRDRDAVLLSGFELQCSDNSDGESVRFAFSRLRQARGRKLVIVISDAMPFLSGCLEAELDSDLAGAEKWVQSCKGEVVALDFSGRSKKYYSRSLKLKSIGDVLGIESLI